MDVYGTEGRDNNNSPNSFRYLAEMHTVDLSAFTSAGADVQVMAFGKWGQTLIRAPGFGHGQH